MMQITIQNQTIRLRWQIEKVRGNNTNMKIKEMHRLYFTESLLFI